MLDAAHRKDAEYKVVAKKHAEKVHFEGWNNSAGVTELPSGFGGTRLKRTSKTDDHSSKVAAARSERRREEDAAAGFLNEHVRLYF